MFLVRVLNQQMINGIFNYVWWWNTRGNYTYLYCLQWIKNDYRLTESIASTLSWKLLSPWRWVLLTRGKKPFKSVCKNVPRVSPLMFPSVIGSFLVPCKVDCFFKETALSKPHRNQRHLCSSVSHLITTLAIPYTGLVTLLFVVFDS